MTNIPRTAIPMLALLLPLVAFAQTNDATGENVSLYIGYSSGGGYDVYARALAQHMDAHLPRHPNIVPVNMPGAGSLVLANWLFNVAPKDGSAFAAIGRGIAFDPLLGSTKSKFNATEFNWIGSMNNEVSVCVAWHTSGITRLEQVMNKELVVGGTGAAADTDQFPKVLNGTIGTKFKVVSGYPGGNDINLAMERGEVQGRCGWSWSSVMATHKDWVKEKKINILAQLATHKHPDLPTVPLIMDYAKTTEQKQIFKLIFSRQPMGRPFLAPPGLPKVRVEVLRTAFMNTLSDKAFLSDAQREGLEINPVSGADVQDIVKEVYQTPKTVADKVAAMVNH